MRSHGHYKGNKPSPEYSTWDGMIGRCTRPSNASYAAYGGSGVVVCERWRKFEAFLEDMGPRPRGHQIDRIDGTKGYEPGNCRWATRSEQARNRKSSLLLTYNGETMTAIGWAERLGFPVHTIWTRKHRGWTDERTLTQPRQNYPRTLKRRVS